MKTKHLVIIGLLIVFAVGVYWALSRELAREEELLRKSISGIVDVDRQLYATGQADVVRTDRLILFLVHPESRQPVAMHFESPLVPPQTIRIGQKNALGGQALSGSFLVVGITDKDGEIFKVTPGEIWGMSPGPVALGTEEFRLQLTQPFRGSLFNRSPTGRMAAAPRGGGGPMAGGSAPTDPRYSITGTITVSKALAAKVSRTDRVILLMFDPESPRPVAFKIIPNAQLPLKFTIGLPPGSEEGAKKAYNLRVVTDKNNNPFGSAPGEVVGRTTEPVPLGSKGFTLEMNQDYVR